jgi:hypothetical protein
MRAKAKRAVENLSKSKAVRFTMPITAQLRVVYPSDLSVLENVPGIDFRNNTVTFTAENYREAYDGIVALIGVARSGLTNVMNEYMAGRMAGTDIRAGYWQYLIQRLVDFWEGNWQPPIKSEVKTEERKYFGVQ